MGKESKEPNASDRQRTGKLDPMDVHVQEATAATRARNEHRYSPVNVARERWQNWSAVKRILVHVTRGDETLDGHVAFLQRLVEALQDIGLEDAFETLAEVDGIEPFALRASQMVLDGAPVQDIVRFLRGMEKELGHYPVIEGVGILLARAIEAHLRVDDQISLACQATMVEQARVEPSATPASEPIQASLSAGLAAVEAIPRALPTQDEVSRRRLGAAQERRVRQALKSLECFEGERVPRTQLHAICGIMPTTLDSHIQCHKAWEQAGTTPDSRSRTTYRKAYVIEYCRSTWRPRRPHPPR